MKPTLFLLIILLSVISCEIDNYDAPQLTISGKIMDVESNGLVESGGINAGTVVKLYEGNSTQPLIYNTLPDGTFTHSKVFAGKYSYVAEGPFTMVGESSQNIIVDKNLEVEINVIPNARLQVDLQELEGPRARVVLQYEKVATDQELVNLSIIWSEFRNPNVYSFAGGAILQENVSSQNLTSGEMHFMIEDLNPNTKYYIRGGAVTNNPGNYYNYSTQIEIQTQ